MVKYQRRHYEAAARELRMSPTRDADYHRMAEIFYHDNPHFNESYFHEAVYGTGYRFKSRQSSFAAASKKVGRLFGIKR